MEQAKFQSILLKVQESLSLAEVLELVFLCSDLLMKDLSSVTAARDLFYLLHSNDLLSSEDPSLLIELLQIIKRLDLVRGVCLDMHQQITRPTSQVQGLCSDASPQLPGRRISPYRRLLYQLAENISSTDLKNIKFLLDKTLPRQKLQQDMTMLQLFLELEKVCLLDAGNLDAFELIIGDNYPNLKRLIMQFKTEHGAGIIAQETKGRHTNDPLDRSVTTKPVQPESAVRNGDKAYTSDTQSTPASEGLLPPSFFSQPPSAQMLSSPAPFSGDASGDVEEQIDNLTVRESSSQVQSQSEECTPRAEETNLSGPDQRNQTNIPTLQEYSMTGDWRGVCLIINNNKFSCPKLKNRDGTDEDKKRLVDVFQWLGFDIQTVQDCDSEGMLKALKDLGNKDHSRADCVVCCVLTHGYDGGVYGVDGKKVSLRELTEPLSGYNCSLLRQKPKLFFIQACRGTENQQVVYLQSDGLDDSSGTKEGISCDATILRHSLPSDADFLMAMATVPFYISYRDKVKGSWFIQSLCEHLLQMVPRGIDLLSILTEVNNDVSRKADASGTKKQIPQPGFTLRKRVIFPIPKQSPPS